MEKLAGYGWDPPRTNYVDWSVSYLAETRCEQLAVSQLPVPGGSCGLYTHCPLAQKSEVCPGVVRRGQNRNLGNFLGHNSLILGN